MERLTIVSNAIRFYGVDRGPRDEVAARIGPTPKEIIREADVPESVLGHWNGRSGYLNPTAQVDREAIEKLLAEDIAHAQAANG